jgi:hypothetical protein
VFLLVNAQLVVEVRLRLSLSSASCALVHRRQARFLVTLDSRAPWPSFSWKSSQHE